MFARILIVVLFLAQANAFAQTTFAPPRIPGIGADRRNITAQNLEARTLGIIKASEFWILRQECTKDAPELLLRKYWPTIQAAAVAVKGKELNPYLMAAIMFIESCGRADARSRTGPLGIGQFTEAAGEEVGLVEKVDEPRRNRRGAILKDKRGRVLTYRKIVRDDRLDPIKSIHGVARRLLKHFEWYEQMDFVIAEYHMGAGRMNQFLSTHTGLKVRINPDRKKGEVSAREVIEKRGLKYARIFFDNLPHYNRASYQLIQRLERVDFSPTYFFRIQMAEALLRFYHGQNGGSPALYEQRRKKHDGARGLMWSFFTPDQQKSLMIADLEALLDARDMGRLVPLPMAAQFLGVQPRLTGPSPIGQADPKNQLQYVAAEASTIGALLYVTAELRRLDGPHFKTLETNSLVRTLETQGGIARGNPNARTSLPTHVMAKAFDIPYQPLGPDLEENLGFLLDDLEAYGMLAFRKERGQRTFHVVPHPDFEQFFIQVYNAAEAQLAARKGRANIK